MTNCSLKLSTASISEAVRTDRSPSGGPIVLTLKSVLLMNELVDALRAHSEDTTGVFL